MASKPSGKKGPNFLFVGDICRVLEAMAPPDLAAEWDNVGLLIGDRGAAVKRVLLTVDLTESVLREALRRRAEMVVAYHPPIFKPISKLTAQAAPIAYAAARAALAVYAMHTALDAAPGGANDVLAEAVGIVEGRPIEPLVGEGDCKVVVFVPSADLPKVASAAFAAGAGRIGEYSECGFSTAGVGTFRGGAGSRPAVGRPGRLERVQELRLEILTPRARLAGVIEAVRRAHSYETPAVDVYPLVNAPPGTGMGRVGRLPRPGSVQSLVARVKRALGVPKVLLAGPARRKVKVAACCAGSCGSMFRSAMAAGADAYVTGEMRHHDALAAGAGGMTVICVGHSNSERIALAGVRARIVEALPAVKATISRCDRDPFRIV